MSCCFVADIGPGRAAPLPDLRRPFLVSRPSDHRCPPCPAWASAVARPSRRVMRSPGFLLHRGWLSGWTDREENYASPPGAVAAIKPSASKRKSAPPVPSPGGVSVRLARHRARPVSISHPPPSSFREALRRLGAWSGAIPGMASRATVRRACGLRSSRGRQKGTGGGKRTSLISTI